jgi:hypothetical protein
VDLLVVDLPVLVLPLASSVDNQIILLGTARLRP